MEKEELKVLCEALKTFDIKQINEIKTGYEKGLTIEQISLYAKPEFDVHQMQQILMAIRSGHFESAYLFAKPEFDSKQMYQIWIGLHNGLSVSEVSTYANPRLDWTKMRNERTILEKRFTK